ncbi:MAG: pitrilysin family protein [Bacteroidota bacterium]|nr:pitrilysin family protein [Bacteroidota bacterium]
MEEFKTHTLKNGLKIIYQEASHAIASHIAFTIHAGSRDDGDTPGTAHCFEHMLFKGTQKRKAHSIINRLEVVGGELNAFTTKEITVIYASVTHQFFERALGLLSELTFKSTFPEKELIKEKKVIKEEINMYLDTPEENIYDEFQEIIFNKHPLGPNILGNHQSVDSINTSKLLDFHQSYYQPQNIALSISSNIPFKKILYYIEKHCGDIKNNATPHERTAFVDYNPQNTIKQTDHLQCHAILGNMCYPYHHENRIPMLLLNNILGGPGMNSRLNLSIREKFGYTYNIESGYSAFIDSGFFHCYLSTEKKYLNKSIDLINKELKKLKEKPLSSMQLIHAKNQFKGQVSLAEENRLNVILALGKNLAQNYPIESLENALKKINKINADGLQEIANEIFDIQELSSLIFMSE